VRQIENGGSYAGMSGGAYQFKGATAAKYGVNPTTSPAAQDAAAIRLTSDNAAVLQKSNLPVNDTTLYMAHQQGAGGAQKLLMAPDTAIAQNVVGKANAQGNPAFFYEGTGDDKRALTVGEVKQKFATKMGSTLPASNIGTGSIGAGQLGLPTMAQPAAALGSPVPVGAPGYRAPTPYVPPSQGWTPPQAPSNPPNAGTPAPTPQNAKNEVRGATWKENSKALGYGVGQGATFGFFKHLPYLSPEYMAGLEKARAAAPETYAAGELAGGAAVPVGAGAFSAPVRGALTGAVIGGVTNAADVALTAHEQGKSMLDAEVSPQNLMTTLFSTAAGGVGGGTAGMFSRIFSGMSNKAIMSQIADMKPEELHALATIPANRTTLENLVAKGSEPAHDILKGAAEHEMTLQTQAGKEGVATAENAAGQRIEQTTQANAWETRGAADKGAQDIAAAKATAEKTGAEAQTAEQAAAAEAENLRNQHATPQPAGDIINQKVQEQATDLQTKYQAKYAEVRDSGVWTEERNIVNTPASARAALADEGHIDPSTMGPQTRVALNNLDNFSKAVSERPGGGVGIDEMMRMDQKLSAQSRQATDPGDKFTLGIVRDQYQEAMVDSLVNLTVKGDGKAVAKSYAEAKQSFATFKDFMEPKGDPRDAELKGFKVLSTIAQNPQAHAGDVASFVLGSSNSGFQGVSSHVVDAFSKTFGDDPQALGALKHLVLERAVGGADTPAKTADAISQFLSSAKTRALSEKLFTADERQALATGARRVAGMQSDAELKRAAAIAAERAVPKAEAGAENAARQAAADAQARLFSAHAEGTKGVTRAQTLADRNVTRAQAEIDRQANRVVEKPPSGSHGYLELIALEDMMNLHFGGAANLFAASHVRGMFESAAFASKLQQGVIKTLGPDFTNPAFVSWGRAAARLGKGSAAAAPAVADIGQKKLSAYAASP
jgi:hypothetical protein